jgi:hypothetical protein
MVGLDFEWDKIARLQNLIEGFHFNVVMALAEHHLRMQAEDAIEEDSNII